MFELSGVSAGYRRGETVIGDIDLEVGPGQLVALLGANGSGKTTTLRIASGLLKPTSGLVMFEGVDVTGWHPSRLAAAGVCHVPEGRAVFRTLTVEENLKVFARDGGATDVGNAFKVFPVLASMRGRLAGRLSGGQQQMLALARAYVTTPKIALLDEVSMGLAPLVIDEIFRVIPALLDRGTSLLIVEQYVERALDMADSVVVLARGRVVFAGPPAVLRESSDLIDAYLGQRSSSP
jgi:branched-chain amino acid transport system ATP-binding protein